MRNIPNNCVIEYLGMKLLDKLNSAFWDWILVWLKKKNKNIIVTKKLSKYVDNLSMNLKNDEIDDYTEILKLKNGSYQTPISEIRNLQLLAKAIKASNILEVGTFRGFTTMSLASIVSDGGKVVTCEINGENIVAATKLWKKYNLDKIISVVKGDAAKSLKKMLSDGVLFDFIYIDADKCQYEKYLEISLLLCRKGGLIVIDNTLWAGLVAYSSTKYSHALSIDRLNKKIFSDKSLTCSLIPAWDGVNIILKN